LVELKNGETFNGHLVNCDNFMNITLREVYQTNSDGDRFWKLKECYIRGSTVRVRSLPSLCFKGYLESVFLQIKYLRVPDTLLDVVKEEQSRAREAGRSIRGTHASGAGRGMAGRGGGQRGKFVYFPTLLLFLTVFRYERRTWRGYARGKGTRERDMTEVDYYKRQSYL
jgi:U6 snRNA-associated Sm-like protein LSm4